jgi:hypothetical protein
MVHYCCVAPKTGQEGLFLEDFPLFEELLK